MAEDNSWLSEESQLPLQSDQETRRRFIQLSAPCTTDGDFTPPQFENL